MAKSSDTISVCAVVLGRPLPAFGHPTVVGEGRATSAPPGDPPLAPLPFRGGAGGEGRPTTTISTDLLLHGKNGKSAKPGACLQWRGGDDLPGADLRRPTWRFAKGDHIRLRLSSVRLIVFDGGLVAFGAWGSYRAPGTDKRRIARPAPWLAPPPHQPLWRGPNHVGFCLALPANGTPRLQGERLLGGGQRLAKSFQIDQHDCLATPRKRIIGIERQRLLIRCQRLGIALQA